MQGSALNKLKQRKLTDVTETKESQGFKKWVANHTIYRGIKTQEEQSHPLGLR